MAMRWLALATLLLLMTSACDDDNTGSEEKAARNAAITVDSLLAEFEGMTYDGEHYYTEDQWVIHDPSAITEIDGFLMIGVTGKAQEDGYDCGLETWYIFPGETQIRPGQCLLQNKPAWISQRVPTSDGAYWAPGFLNSRTLYYSVPSGGSMGDAADSASCIGKITATGRSPNLVWTDHGAPITCTALGELNTDEAEPGSIDAETFVDDDGTQYLIYGGGHIWATRINAQTGATIEGETQWSANNENYIHLANGPTLSVDGEPVEEEEWVEAAFMFKHDTYYYLFVNWYSCCLGTDSTYEIHVGRSASPRGPFVDSKGVAMLDGGGDLVLDETSGSIGPGHAGIFEYRSKVDQQTRYVFSNHHYPESGTPWATVETHMLTWSDDGWPVVSDESFDAMDFWGTD